MRILVPQGIGDSIWCMFKVQDLVAKTDPGPIDIKIACWHVDAAESRAKHFLERFVFVNSVEMFVMPRIGNEGPVLLPGPPADGNGIYRYMADGRHPHLPDIDYAMMPNGPLEKAIRLEEWLPQFETNWDIMEDFQFMSHELNYADEFEKENGPFVTFFMASLANNTVSGHNRGPLWTPHDWLELGEKIHNKYGVKILVVGTTWDEDYYEKVIYPHTRHKDYWINKISQWPIAQTYAVVNKSRFVVSYQSGIGIVSHYLGRPVAIFWRPKGNSISPNSYVSFEEGMSSAWARPDYLAQNKLLPCIYGKHTVDDIMNFAETHGW